MGLAVQKFKQQMMNLKNNLTVFFKWVLLSLLVGIVVGGAGTAFWFCMKAATDFRTANQWVEWFLPLGGVIIVALYRLCGIKKAQGTNLVLLAVRSPERVPLRMAPLIFISTVITHLVGGSAGREGAALQLGGSLGFQIGRVLRLDEKDLHIITMCGMSAAFSALFGTPIASAVFAMEVVSVGVMYYAALVPCAIAALTGTAISRYFGGETTAFLIRGGVPQQGILPFVQVVVLSALCAGVSVLFCYLLHGTHRLYHKYLPNYYPRAAIGGALVLLMAFLCGTQDYLGAGMNVIQAAMNGTARPEAFLLKMLFTAVTLGAGFKGGEIVPSFFVGATFGCVAGGLLGLNPAFGAAIGLISVFCGVTNCPITSMIISIELFGAQGAVFFLLACAVSYMLSGYTGLYSRQRIMYSKYKPEFMGASEKTS
jgi:H+/Cl- antiporter ClcA